MGETVRTASVLEIYNEAIRVLGDEKKALLVELAKLKTKSFLKNNLIKGVLLLGGIAFFVTGVATFVEDFSYAPFINVLFIVVASFFYIKKKASVKNAISQAKSYFNNLHKNMLSGAVILSLILFLGLPVLASVIQFFNISASYFLFAGAILIFYFYKNFINLDAGRIMEMNNRLIAIDSEVEELKKKKDAMLKQSLSEADEFLAGKE
jgi:hypothetical protein